MASEDESLVPDASLKKARASTSHHRRNSGKAKNNAQTGDRRAPTSLWRDVVALSGAVLLVLFVIVIDAPLRAELVRHGVSLKWTADVEPTSYDLFLATLGTVMSALIALYFTVAAAVLSVLKEHHRAGEPLLPTLAILRGLNGSGPATHTASLGPGAASRPPMPTRRGSGAARDWSQSPVEHLFATSD
jgi:hypothetical protein